MKTRTEINSDSVNATPLSMDAFAEDWNASQFWYTDDTAAALADVLLEGATAETRIAVISAPSVYVHLIKKLNTLPPPSRPTAHLLEYDTRFSILPNHIPYDYKQPLKLPSELKGTIDHLILDPPFLDDDCQTKTAMTAHHLLRPPPRPKPTPTSTPQNPTPKPTSPNDPPKIIICTATTMNDLISKLYGRKWGVSEKTGFMVKHKGGLRNEFGCWCNFDF